MAKPIKANIKLQIPAGKATPAPPVGPALGQHGLNIIEFTKAFNDQTKDKGDAILPVEITVYEDRTFDFKVKTPSSTYLLMKAAGIEKGSGNPLKEKVGKVSRAQIEEIAKTKMPDLQTNDLAGAKKIIEGTARSMGLTVEG